ncbi:MAG: hypothetical protein ABIE94_07025 [archaeon]
MPLFHKNNKPRIYSIEINDKKINEQIGRVLAALERHLRDFKRIIEKNELVEKHEEAEELLEAFMLLRETSDALMVDVEKIQNIEMQEKQFLVLNDQLFLEDKRKQLETIRDNIDAAITIIKDRPSVKEYKQELLEVILQQVEEIKQALHQVRDDDEKLNEIYSSISNI